MMKLICLIKYTPDVENFIYDYEKNVLVRENTKLILNPDDACAVAFALKIKAKAPDTFVEVVTMAPPNVTAQLEDLLRRHVDQATLISDSLFVGSDTYVTSKILAEYLKNQSYDCIITGTHAIDGDTSHVPSQIGEILELDQLSGIVKIDEASFVNKIAVVDVDLESKILTYEIRLPAVLSVQKESKYKLPYVSYKDLNLDVHDKLQVITNKELRFEKDKVGLEGSLTRVNSTTVKKLDQRNKRIVTNDEAGIDEVYDFLKTKGLI